MEYLAIVAMEDGRVTKFAEFATLTEAQTHAGAIGGFAWHNAGGASVGDLRIAYNNTVTIETADPLVAWRETASLSRADFVNAAADAGLLTDDEAIEAAKRWMASLIRCRAVITRHSR